ncbi:MAG TPA: 3-hydroxyacyl-CoA dehydrogenase NAD-binding domain-containing protein [Eoetvoesiella sp.]
MTQPICIEHVNEVAVIRLHSLPVNALSRAVRVALYEALSAAASDQGIKAIVLAGSARFFSAGADIAEFQSNNPDAAFAGRDPVEINGLLEGLSKPVVAAIEGVALGGGLELAMSCHARIAAKSASFGLPEVRLGVIPGAGGTQRLPRLVGLDAAMRMMLSGQAIDAERALDLGLVDQIVSSDAVSAAIEHAVALAKTGDIRATGALSIKDASVLATGREDWKVYARKVRAPKSVAEQLFKSADDAVNLSFDKALQRERERFVACNSSDAAAGLQHAFFATGEAGRSPAQFSGCERRTIERVAVIGGGTMGRGIAMAFANSAYAVKIIEADDERAITALNAIRVSYDAAAKGGKLDVDEAARRIACVQASANFNDVSEADLIIEAVPENLALKLEVSKRLGQACKAGAIIASNTSTLNVDLLAKESGRAQDFLGLHFFSPADVMRLVEVIQGEQTAGDVIATAMDLVRRLGKHPVLCGVCYGFIGNRMLEPYLRETEALLLEGCSPAQIDAAIEAFGMAMGPCRMMDLAGVDVVAKVVEEQDKQGMLPADPLYRVICRELAEQGLYGQKSGKGFYVYEGRRPVEYPTVLELIRARAERSQVPQRADVTNEEIVSRCLFPLINEGFKIVEEGIAHRESDVDVVWLSGYGFPAERGGPLFYARRHGLKEICETLNSYAARTGNPHGYWDVTDAIRTAE